MSVREAKELSTALTLSEVIRSTFALAGISPKGGSIRYPQPFVIVAFNAVVALGLAQNPLNDIFGHEMSIFETLSGVAPKVKVTISLSSSFEVGLQALINMLVISIH